MFHFSGPLEDIVCYKNAVGITHRPVPINQASPSFPEQPLVSVIIPCYNHAHFLSEAIESVLNQTYPFIEIIVVDDGSKDNTREVAQRYPEVTYIYKQNQGLSAARNTGIDQSKGAYLVFLDADDWLYLDAIETNVKYLQQNPDLGFVSGGFDEADANKNRNIIGSYPVTQDHFVWLLNGNYICMHATVMFQRWIFKKWRYDTSLKACEDYDLYLSVARNHPVMHHQHKLAVYRRYDTSMSFNIPLMLRNSLKVLEKHSKDLRSDNEIEAFKKGILNYQKNYGPQIISSFLKNSAKTSQNLEKEDFRLLSKYLPRLMVNFIKHLALGPVKTLIKKYSPQFFLRSLHKAGIYKEFYEAPRHINKGDFDRTMPFSIRYGFDRGGAIDRYYIENFLQQQANCIKGNVLEIGDNEYTMRYGGKKVSKSDIFHVNADNPKATIIGDLSNAPHVPDNSYDCIIMTQTLQFIYDFKGALQTCYRILKPGGTLLLTVPGISQIEYGELEESWFWSFTRPAMQKAMTEIFPVPNVEVQNFGNVFVATALLYGMGLPEIKKEQMDFTDPHYQVIITVKGTKPAIA
ncbi:glycosyltransferase [Adhaeribacter rhizoryzae]|uniref:Glycosyltransferase n=1 Tax=Adhaeribacter rhizoryzae TaxID=2607907 RepID=A0A5M6D9J4_9BACT|nr:glycosyltransferase [Adhaeribacter rhizoryzae]KAA5544217.1 glycosyltransferase [Adhaeribacter rhizoryzae]